MPDARPAPQYGEYATPEEVAALRGVPVSTPTPSPPAPTPSPPVTVARPRRAGARRYDGPVTIGMLLFGLINLVQSVGPLLEFANTLDLGLTGTAYDDIDFGTAANVGGWVLLGILTEVFVGAVAASLSLLRRRRIAFWVPLVAGGVTIAAWVVVLVVVVVQTPGALPTLGT